MTRSNDAMDEYDNDDAHGWMMSMMIMDMYRANCGETTDHIIYTEVFIRHLYRTIDSLVDE